MQKPRSLSNPAALRDATVLRHVSQLGSAEPSSLIARKVSRSPTSMSANASAGNT